MPATRGPPILPMPPAVPNQPDFQSCPDARLFLQPDLTLRTLPERQKRGHRGSPDCKKIRLPVTLSKQSSLRKSLKPRSVERECRLQYSRSKDPLPRGRTSVTGLPLWQRTEDTPKQDWRPRCGQLKPKGSSKRTHERKSQVMKSSP